METPRDASLENLVCFVVDQVRESFRRNTARRELMFYQIVQSGQVSVTRAVLESFSAQNYQEELTWLLGKVEQNSNNSKSLKGFHLFLRITFVTICCLILSPLVLLAFTIIQSTAKFFYDRYRRPLYQDIDLPLAFAAMSERPEIVELFFSYGTSIDSTYKNGNNIFHYLADVSIYDLDLTFKIHRTLRTVSGNEDLILHCLLDMRNNEDENALEVVSKYGSLQYLDYLLKYHMCFGEKLQFVVSDEVIWTKDLNMMFLLQTNSNRANKVNVKSLCDMRHVCFCVECPDVEPTTAVSHLLNNVAKRNFTTLAEGDFASFLKSRSLITWMNKKIKKYTRACILQQFASVLLTTTVLMCVLSINADPELRLIRKNAKFIKGMMQYDIISEKHMSELSKLQSCHQRQTHETRKNSSAGVFLSPLSARWDAFDFVMIGFTFSCIQSLCYVGRFILFMSSNFIAREKSLKKALTPVISRFVPGSDVDTSLKMLSHTLFMLSVIAFISTRFIVDESVEAYDELEAVWRNRSSAHIVQKTLHVAKSQLNKSLAIASLLTFLLYSLLLVRLLALIHALRLLPAIGFYIITVKKMTTNLMWFGVIFTLLLVAFALMFHMDQSRGVCPWAKEAFSNIQDSLFATYGMVLSGGSTKAFAGSMASRIIYLTFTAVATLLLLNLVVALMTTQATEISQEPWRSALCRLEVLNEVLGTEADIRLFRKCFHWLSCKCRNSKGTGHQSSAKQKTKAPKIIYNRNDDLYCSS